MNIQIIAQTISLFIGMLYTPSILKAIVHYKFSASHSKVVIWTIAWTTFIISRIVVG
jgi:hypothetical protein